MCRNADRNNRFANVGKHQTFFDFEAYKSDQKNTNIDSVPDGFNKRLLDPRSRGRRVVPPPQPEHCSGATERFFETYFLCDGPPIPGTLALPNSANAKRETNFMNGSIFGCTGRNTNLIQFNRVLKYKTRGGAIEWGNHRTMIWLRRLGRHLWICSKRSSSERERGLRLGGNPPPSP